MIKMMNTFCNKLIKLASCFLPSSKKRKAFRKKYLLEMPLKLGTNSVFRVNDSGEKVQIFKQIPGLKLAFPGENNVVEISEHAKFTQSAIVLSGDNGKIELGSGVYHDICIKTFDGIHQSVKIGNNFSCCYNVSVTVNESYTSLIIGDGCMLSSNISIWPTDCHAMLNKGVGQAYNLAKPIIIGNHVWIGYNIIITKGTVIPDNCVIGAGAVVSGKFTEPNTVIAGNPAKVVRTNIDWNRKTAYDFNNIAENHFSETK